MVKVMVYCASNTLCVLDQGFGHKYLHVKTLAKHTQVLCSLALVITACIVSLIIYLFKNCLKKLSVHEPKLKTR